MVSSIAVGSHVGGGISLEALWSLKRCAQYLLLPSMVHPLLTACHCVLFLYFAQGGVCTLFPPLARHAHLWCHWLHERHP